MLRSRKLLLYLMFVYVPQTARKEKNIGCHIFERTAHIQDKVFFKNKPLQTEHE